MQARSIVMLGTSLATQGGISAVVHAYRAYGLFERWPLLYLETHCQGSAGAKLRIATAAWLRFCAMLLSRRVLAVHVHSASRASFWRKLPFMLLARLGRRPLIFHLHGGGFRDFYAQECGALGRFWIRFILRHAACVIVLSPTWHSWVKAIAPAARMRVIPNPAPPLKPHRQTIDANRPRLLFLGAIIEKKGVFDLLRAVSWLLADYPNLRVILAGSGTQEAALEQLADELGMTSNLELPGWVDAAQRDVLLAQADIFILPSYHEGMPMSILEAMAAGTPVIATRIGGVPDLIRAGVDGLLVEAGDIAALANAIETLLRLPQRARAMAGHAAERAAQNFGMTTVAAQLASIYQELGALPCQSVALA